MGIISATALVLALNTGVVPVRHGASAEYALREEITRCRTPAGFNQPGSKLSAGLVDAASRSQAGSQPTIEAHGELLLVRAEDKADIIHLVHGSARWSASQHRASITETGLDEAAYHLVIDRPEGKEHLLFAIAGDGIGQLIWTSPFGNAITECRPGAPA